MSTLKDTIWQALRAVREVAELVWEQLESGSESLQTVTAASPDSAGGRKKGSACGDGR
jgi:hypothetical protein